MRFSASTVLLLAAAASTTPSAVTAFSTGAGGCSAGGPSPGGGHLANPNIMTGDLVQGGYSFSIDGEPLPLTAPLQVGESYDMEVGGPDFRGVLIMSASPNVDLVPTTATLQPAAACAGTGVGITHVNPEFKQVAEGSFTCTGPGTVELGVNVVVANNFQEGSIYYYTGFTVQCTDGAGSAATEDPTSTAPPTNATTTPEATEDPTATAVPTEDVTSDVTLESTNFTDSMFNETDVPTTDEDFDDLTDAPTVASAPTTAPVAVGVVPTLPPVQAPASMIENAPPSSANTHNNGMWLLSLGATAAAAITTMMMM